MAEAKALRMELGTELTSRGHFSRSRVAQVLGLSVTYTKDLLKEALG